MILLSSFYGGKNVTDYIFLFISAGKINIPQFVDLNKIFGTEGDTLIITILIENKKIYNIEAKVKNGYLVDEDIYHSLLIETPVYKMEPTKAKVALVYVYSECNSEFDKIIQKRRNLNYFFTHHFVPDIKYKFIVNDSSKQELKFPLPNELEHLNKDVHYRENTGYDYGGYIAGCNLLDSEEPEGYDYYIFLNDSCVGPFLNVSVTCTNNWINHLIDSFNQHSNTSIFGSTINLNHYDGTISPHVQGYMFMLNRESYQCLRTETDLLSTIRQNKQKIIIEQEIGISSYLISKGKSISSLIYELKNIDSQNMPLRYAGDCLWRHSEKIDRKINPYETLFVKDDPKFDNIHHQIKDVLVNL
jgi:hypothetical protein